jgi:hypothetical protein
MILIRDLKPIFKKSKYQRDKTCLIMTANYTEKSITQLVMIEGNKDEGFIHLHSLLREGIV